MAKQKDRQKAVVERVLHDFKQGRLESGSGQPVTSRRQAIAIGLSEAGVANPQRATDANSQAGATKARTGASGETKAALYARAKARNIPGRARMRKAELARALG